MTFRVVAGVAVLSLDDDGDELRTFDNATAQVIAGTPPGSDAVTSASSSDGWLVASVAGGAVNVTADYTALSAGNYSGSVTITCASGAVYTVPFFASVAPVDNIVAAGIATTLNATRGHIEAVEIARGLTLNYQVAMPLGVELSVTYGQVDFSLYSSSGSFPSVKDFPWLSFLHRYLNLSPSPFLDVVALECNIGAAGYALDYWLNDPRSPYHRNSSANPILKLNGSVPDLTLAAGTYTASVHINAPFGADASVFTTKTVAVSLVVS